MNPCLQDAEVAEPAGNGVNNDYRTGAPVAAKGEPTVRNSCCYLPRERSHVLLGGNEMDFETLVLLRCCGSVESLFG